MEEFRMLERIYRKASKKVMALLLAVCMVISMSPPMMAAAVTDSGEPVVFSGFASLPEEVRLQNVALGVSLADLVLPDTLEAYPAEPNFGDTEETPPAVSKPEDSESDVVDRGTPPESSTPEANSTPAESSSAPDSTPPESSAAESAPDAPPSESGAPIAGESADEQTQASSDEPAAGETTGADELAAEVTATKVLSAYVEGDVSVTIEGVTWESEPAFDGDTAGTYTFTAVLPAGYTVEEGVSLPEITVTVGQPMLRTSRAATDFGTNCTWEITADGVLTIAPKDASGGTLPEFSDYFRPWDDVEDTIKKVIVSAGVKSGASLNRAFSGLQNCTAIDLTGLDTSAATDMQRMFSGTYAETITFGGKFTTENVTNMSKMFLSCHKLTSLDFSKFNTANVTNMSNMFEDTLFPSLDLRDFNTANVENMSGMFKGSYNLTSLDLSSFDTAKVKDMSSMFELTAYAFSLPTTLDLSSFDTSNVTNMSSMFNNQSKLSQLILGEKFNTANVTDMSYMFRLCRALPVSAVISKLDTGNVKNMQAMFFGTSYSSDTGSETSFTINLNTEKVEDMSFMFAYCYALESITFGNTFNTAKVKSMEDMFRSCRLLTTLDVSMFNTGNATNMKGMFTECTGLTSLDVSKFNTSSVEYMNNMFNGCTGLTTLDLSAFDFTSLFGADGMFSNCSKLETVKLPKATQLDYQCFLDCGALTSLTLGAAPPTVNTAFNFTAVDGGKLGLVLALPDGTPLTESTNPKLSAAVAAYKAVDDGDVTDNLWYGWQVKATPSLPAEATPSIAIDYAGEKLTGFVSGGSYTVNGTAVSPAAGTLAIGSGWLGTTVSIVKKASDTTTHTDSAAQSLPIPARPAAPTTPGKADETVGGLNDGKLTGLTANKSYQLSADNGTTWTTKTADSTGAIIGLAPGSYTLRIPATSSSFASAPTAPVTIASGPKTDISAKLTVTIGGWTYGEAAKAPSVAATGITLDQSKAAYTYSGTANDGTTLTSSTTAPTKTGSYTVTAKYEDDTQKGTVTSASFTVAKAPLTLTGGTVTTRGYVAGDTTATVTAVTFGGLKNGETLAITTDYTVTNAEFADANAGTNKPVTATVALASSTKAANYTLSGAALNTTGTITKIEDGTQNPDYAAAKAALDAVHIITNVTPTLGDVTLPTGWSFTGDPATRLAGIEGQANQNFAVKYTSQNPNYPDVALLAQAFPVTTVLMDVRSGLSMVTLNKDEVKDIAPVTVAVKGAPLPNSGDYAESNIGLFSALPKIATISGNVGANQGAVNVTGVAKGLTMVGIAYKNTPTMMLGYILIQVNDPAASSQNNIEEIKDIGDTLERLIADPTQPTAVEQATVNAVASEITKLPDTAKAQLTVDDVKKIDALQQTVQNITVTPTLPVVAGAPTLASNFTVVGAAVASGAAANDTVTITATPKPVSGEIKMELDLAMTVGGGEQQLKSPLFFEMELPAGIDPAKLKISHILAGGSTEEVSFTASGQTVSFKLDSFSGLQFIVSGGTPTPPPSGGDGSSGGSSSDDGYDFWMEVKDKIQKADDGDVIKVNAKDYDKMPESVMDALRKNEDVSLVITWNGKTITIPAGKAQKNEPGRIYWPLSKLAELYADITEDTVLKQLPQNPETGGPGKFIPVTGGGELITLEAPAPVMENAQVITPRQPKAITPPDAGFEQDTFAGTPDAKAVHSANVTAIVGVFLLLAVLCGTGFWVWKRRKWTEKQLT